MAPVGLLGWMFLLRLQAEFLPPAGQSAGGHLVKDDRLLQKAAIGLQRQKLIIKLTRRKNMEAGAAIAQGGVA